MTSKIDYPKLFLIPALITGLLLLIPLAAKLLTDEMNWSLFDFAVMGILIFSTVFIYKLITLKKDNLVYKYAAALALISCFLLLWVNLAVGILGSEDNPANLLYGLVLLVGLLGSIVVRFKPVGMAKTLFIMCLVQLTVPVIAVLIWKTEAVTFDEFMISWHDKGLLGVVGVNLFFASVFAGASLLFRYASSKQNKKD